MTPTYTPSIGKLLPWTIALLAGAALAQTKTESTPQQPLPVQLTYTSPLSSYQAYSEQPVQSWQDSNATVEKNGGWRTYAKEARMPEADENKTPSASPHEGHHGGEKQ